MNDTGWKEQKEKAGVDFHGGHACSDGVDYAAAEGLDGIDGRREMAVARLECERQILENRVKADDRRRTAGANGGGQAIGIMNRIVHAW